MTIQAGEFWLADIPFTDGSASKIRPVLVLWLDGLDAVVAGGGIPGVSAITGNCCPLLAPSYQGRSPRRLRQPFPTILRKREVIRSAWLFRVNFRSNIRDDSHRKPRWAGTLSECS